MLLLLAACSPGPIQGASETVVEGEDPPAEDAPGGGGGVDSGGDEEEEEPDGDFGCSSLFAQDHVVDYQLTVEEGDWHHLEREWATADGTKDYVPITTLTVDGEEVPDAEIRLKGNYSCCWVGEKMQFVIAFNEVNEDARFHGERKVAMDSPYYDPTVLKNRLANWYLSSVGLPGTCTNSAIVTVNGEYYGLYAHMEELDHEWLERNFGKDDSEGYLWKYGYVLDNHEGEDVDTTRINTFWSSYNPDDFTPMGEPDQWLSEWAAEAILPDGDGYWCCGHNYYLYDHPTRGMLWIPWDQDGTFDWVAYNTDPVTVWYPDATPHMAAMLGNPEWRAQYVDRVTELAAQYGTDEMLDLYATWLDQTYAYGVADPYRYYDDSYYEYYIDSLPASVVSRKSYLDAWVEEHAAE